MASDGTSAGGWLVALVLVVPGCLLASEASATAADPVTCGGQEATIIGTDGPDTLVGTDGPDVIAGLAGHNRIEGRGGDDVICGGDSKDVLRGGAGSDTVYGIDGVDRLVGGSGDDAIHAGPDGGDVVRPGSGDDRVELGDAARTYLDHGPDTLDYHLSRAGIHVDAAAGTVEGDRAGHDQIVDQTAQAGLWLIGTTHDDVMIGGPCRDRLDGRIGDDILRGRGGDDVLLHQTGPGTTVLAGGGGRDVIQSGEPSTRLGVRDGSVVIHGGGRGDVIDTLAMAGARVDGGRGWDHIVARVPLDQPLSLDGGAGTDPVTLRLQAPTDGAPYGQVTLDLTAESVRTSSGLTAPVAGFESAVAQQTGRAPFPEITGWSLLGTAGRNHLRLEQDVPGELRGRGGDDVLIGAGSDDLLDGGEGYDRGRANDGNDTCISLEQGQGCEVITP